MHLPEQNRLQRMKLKRILRYTEDDRQGCRHALRRLRADIARFRANVEWLRRSRPRFFGASPPSREWSTHGFGARASRRLFALARATQQPKERVSPLRRTVCSNIPRTSLAEAPALSFSDGGVFRGASIGGTAASSPESARKTPPLREDNAGASPARSGMFEQTVRRGDTRFFSASEVCACNANRRRKPGSETPVRAPFPRRCMLRKIVALDRAATPR